MKRVLLILSASRMSTACADDAVDAAEREHSELVVLFILDAVHALDVQDRLADTGFLGKAPSGRFLLAVRREHKRRGDVVLAEIAAEAERRGIPCRTEFVEGDFLTRSLEAARKESAAVIFVAKRDRPAISRLVSGSEAQELKESAPCRVMIHDGRDSR